MMNHGPDISAPNPARPGRDRGLMFGLIALVGLGLWSLGTATGWAEIGAQLARLQPWQVAILLALSAGNYLLRGLRWHGLARRLGLPTGLSQNLRHYLGGFAMSVTPGRLGELVRMRWLRRETGWTLERTAPLALMDRAGDLAVMALLLALALTLAADRIAGAVPVAALALAAAVTATRPRLLSALVTRLYRALGRFPRAFARARGAARRLTRFCHGPTLALALGLGFLGWLAEGYAFHLLLGFLGAEIALWKAVSIFVFATLAGGLTGAPGGLGGAEAAMIALLSLEGVPLDTSVPATAVIRLTTLWFAIALGLAVFPIAERAAARATA
ncbi:lysylphosphatidylglycerol synthase transmembrane domain-containing protein [Rhodobacter capsulatus]|uniref:lysylphosphatidylglycerol synthase transmembrane domain-containing protein n=1 Tax=Rhodobacter capsulatus TaxID=1061 RepID=UPI0003D2E818|nr:lysylphosphatidylglycerol synthase transmembrane domain-containing protein [Rhodobacter capsulatus]ETD88827.1 membrane protein [Rhodobacter capsulatus YW2]